MLELVIRPATNPLVPGMLRTLPGPSGGDARVGLETSGYSRMYPSVCSGSHSQRDVNGALDRYVDGQTRNDVKQRLSGLAVLRQATEAQIQLAGPAVQAGRNFADGQIRLGLENYGETARDHS